jgi:hypothetical protein
LIFLVFAYLFDMGRHLCWSFDDFLRFATSSAKNHSMFAFYPKPISSLNILSMHTSSFSLQISGAKEFQAELSGPLLGQIIQGPEYPVQVWAG